MDPSLALSDGDMRYIDGLLATVTTPSAAKTEEAPAATPPQRKMVVETHAQTSRDSLAAAVTADGLSTLFRQRVRRPGPVRVNMSANTTTRPVAARMTVRPALMPAPMFPEALRTEHSTNRASSLSTSEEKPNLSRTVTRTEARQAAAQARRTRVGVQTVRKTVQGSLSSVVVPGRIERQAAQEGPKMPLKRADIEAILRAYNDTASQASSPGQPGWPNDTLLPLELKSLFGMDGRLPFLKRSLSFNFRERKSIRLPITEARSKLTELKMRAVGNILAFPVPRRLNICVTAIQLHPRISEALRTSSSGHERPGSCRLQLSVKQGAWFHILTTFRISLYAAQTIVLPAARHTLDSDELHAIANQWDSSGPLSVILEISKFKDAAGRTCPNGLEGAFLLTCRWDLAASNGEIESHSGPAPLVFLRKDHIKAAYQPESFATADLCWDSPDLLDDPAYSHGELVLPTQFELRRNSPNWATSKLLKTSVPEPITVWLYRFEDRSVLPEFGAHSTDYSLTGPFGWACPLCPLLTLSSSERQLRAHTALYHSGLTFGVQHEDETQPRKIVITMVVLSAKSGHQEHTHHLLESTVQPSTVPTTPPVRNEMATQPPPKSAHIPRINPLEVEHGKTLSWEARELTTGLLSSRDPHRTEDAVLAVMWLRNILNDRALRNADFPRSVSSWLTKAAQADVRRESQIARIAWLQHYSAELTVNEVKSVLAAGANNI